METVNSVPSTKRTSPVIGFTHDRLSSMILRFMNRLKQTGKSPNTISSYRNDLGLFSHFLIENKINPEVPMSNLQEEWLFYLDEKGRKSPASVRRAQMSVRTFLHFLVGEGIIQNSPLLETKSPKQPSHDLLLISEEKFEKLNSALKKQSEGNDEKAIRDYSIFLILGEYGLKASEAANLTWGDVLLIPSADRSGGSLKVAGPNERVIKFDKELFEVLRSLKNLRARMDLSVNPDAKLFFGYLNMSRKTRTPSLHRHGIKFVVYEFTEEILGTPFNSESLRNRAIQRWLHQGLNAQQVADLAGYSSLHSLERFNTTGRGERSPKRHMK